MSPRAPDLSPFSWRSVAKRSTTAVVVATSRLPSSPVADVPLAGNELGPVPAAAVKPVRAEEYCPGRPIAAITRPFAPPRGPRRPTWTAPGPSDPALVGAAPRRPLGTGRGQDV